MVTQREYLVGKGLAKPGRGRFSREAKAALAAAVAEGMIFTDTQTAPAPNIDQEPVEAPKPKDTGVPLFRVGGSDYKLRNVRALTGLTEDGVTIAFDSCSRCLGHLTLCSCKKPKAPYGVVQIIDLPDWTPVG
jgi:hypothetical protein